MKRGATKVSLKTAGTLSVSREKYMRLTIGESSSAAVLRM